MLIEAGTEIDAKDQVRTEGPYYCTAFPVLFVSFQHLLSQDGWTALNRACSKGHKDVIVVLIKAGADTEAKIQVSKIPSDTALAYLYLIR